MERVKIGIKVLLSIGIIVERRDRWKCKVKGYRKASRYLKKKGLERRELNPRVLGTRLLNVSKPINSDLRNYFHPIPIRYSSRLISKLARQRDRGKLFHDISYKLSSFLSLVQY